MYILFNSDRADILRRSTPAAQKFPPIMLPKSLEIDDNIYIAAASRGCVINREIKYNETDEY